MKYNTLRRLDFRAELYTYEPPLTADSVFTEVGTISVGFVDPVLGRPEIYSEAPLLPGARLYNLRDKRGRLLYPTDDTGDTSSIFAVTGIAAEVDPFNRVIGYTYRLTRIT